MTIRGLFLPGSIAAVVIAVVVGVLLIESPTVERQKKVDSRRARDLNTLECEITLYHQRNGNIPQSLESLSDEIDRPLPITDPVTGKPYEYRVVEAESYELCAEFSRDNRNDARDPGIGYGWRSTKWSHDIGRYCFSLEIPDEPRC